MAITVEDVQRVVGSNDLTRAGEALAMATALLADVVAQAFRPIPSAVLDAVTLEVAKQWFDRSQTMAGASQFADLSTGRPVMAPRDPLTTVWPVLRRYVTPF